VRALDEQGALARDDGRVTLTRPVDEVRIPDTVQELIGARLDRLPPSAKRVAQIASVLGRQFTREQLASLLDGEEVDLESELTTLVGRGVLHRKDASAPDEFRFGESLVQQVAYESLLLRERRRLHARVAEALEKQAADGGDPSYTVLAFHHARAEQPEPAIEALLAAAGRAAALPSYPQALELYRKAWDLAETAIEQAAPEARERLERAGVRAGLGLSGMLVVHGPPEFGEGEAIAERAVELARKVGDDEAHAAILGNQGMLALSRDGERMEDGIKLISRGYELARAAGLELRALTIGRGLAWAHVVDGRLADGTALLRQILAELERLGEKERGSDVYLGACYFYQRARVLAEDLDGLEEELDATLALAERKRNRTVHCATSATRAQLHLLRGEFAQALELAESALELAERIGSAAAVRTASAIALLAAMALGKSDSTRRWVESMDRSVEQVGDLAISSLLLVEALLAAGDLPRAQRMAELSVRRARGRLHTLFATIAHGMVRVRIGGEQPGEPERTLKRGLVLARELGLVSPEIAALISLAELARSRDEAALAAELARKADSLIDATGFERYRARTRCVIEGCNTDCAVAQP
jgi:tetratricopeptide (TPR) repeat protein